MFKHIRIHFQNLTTDRSNTFINSRKNWEILSWQIKKGCAILLLQRNRPTPEVVIKARYQFNLQVVKMFTTKFQPALNKAGLSKLTFIGTDVLEGEKDRKLWSMFKFRFLCMGKFHGSDQEITLSTGFQYEENNLLGRTLSAMGFKIPNPNTVLDNDGFEVVKPENLDDDGFEVIKAPKLDVMEFLDTKIDSVYVAKLSKNQKNFWQIDVNTLKPLKSTKKIS